jgi:hypothetical protein
LLALVRPFGPGVEGDALAFDRDPPVGWVGVLTVLHTGVRALLAGRRWYGCGSERATAAPRPLDPSAPIPSGITLLCVEGDDRWDRIDPLARIDHPGLFDPVAGSSPEVADAHRPENSGRPGQSLFSPSDGDRLDAAGGAPGQPS